MAATGKQGVCWSSRTKEIIGRLLKLVGYIHNHKILPGNIFGLSFEKQDGRHGQARSFVGPLEQRKL